ncbi:MAG: matrixin family metalloprotease, partial [Hymenobacter sp.]
SAYMQPLASDYVSWSDTQIQVRVPATNGTGGTAGTGPIQVTNSDGSSRATSSNSLTVTYVVSGPSSNGVAYRARLVDTDTKGGYTLRYSSASLPAAAQAPFAAALQTWRCNTGMNRTIGAPTTSDAVSNTDNINIVRFDTGTELPTGVLGVTRTYFSGCSVNGVLAWRLAGTDYTFDSGTNWYYGTDPAGIASNQYDFQSVALHELGHGQLLGHIILPGAVMNFNIGNSQVRRTLSNNNDIAGGRDEISYSTAIADPCGASLFLASTCPLPVQLTAFAARYQPGQGTTLSWATATELNSAAFIIESQADALDSTWQALPRVAAAGRSTSPRQYQALDARPLAGTRYYRLRQVDLDGTVAYSPVVSVAAAATTLAAYPNPATGRVQLSGPLAAGATAQVRLLDATGRCVLRTVGPAGPTVRSTQRPVA